MCYLVIVTYKFSEKLNSVAKLIETLINQFGVTLIEEIIFAFTSITYDLDNMDEDIESLTFADIVESQLQLMRLLMFKVYHFKKYT